MPDPSCVPIKVSKKTHHRTHLWLGMSTKTTIALLRQHLKQKIQTSTGNTRIRCIQQWMETVSCTDHGHIIQEPLFALPHREKKCDACALTNVDDAATCFTCDRQLGTTCGCLLDVLPGTMRGTCVLCAFKDKFFLTCGCGVDECYNYWGINPKLDTYRRCWKHRRAVADRCVTKVKCKSCRNKVPFPFCVDCEYPVPDVATCATCRTWSIDNFVK